MSEIVVTLSANAGVVIRAGGKTIWVDALHEEKQAGFSTLSAKLQAQLLAGDPPDYICYTHCHGDHYSRRLTAAAAGQWPQAKLFLPQTELEGQTLITGDGFSHRDGNMTLTFLRLPHEGAQYADVKHYGLLISLPEGNILIPGDCATASPALSAAIGERKIDVALLDFPWITLRRGREFLAQNIHPAHILVYHLPFEEDDICGYRQAAEKAACQMDVDVRLLRQPLQTETIQM